MATIRDTAETQLDAVNELATRLLNGVTHKSKRFGKEYLWSMHDIASAFAEQLEAGMVLSLYHGDQSAVLSSRKEVYSCAQAVAFQALDLENDPFIDLAGLEDAANDN